MSLRFTHWCCLLLLLAFSIQAQTQPVFNQNKTLTYTEVISSYDQLAKSSNRARLFEFGSSDCGENLNLFLVSASNISEQSLEEIIEDKAVVFINNGIHPGESCGIDASIVFAENLLGQKMNAKLVYAIIPVYNIGGSLNRGVNSRANQNGPEEHGFRGNARHLDLNRDFIKMDALNTWSFVEIFQLLKPHIFVDTHTSNGADYQYTLTLISTQKDKLNPILSELMTDKLEPYLYTKMKKEGWEMSPYVNVHGRVPNDGFSSFLETPRFASGYTSLHNCIGFITEAHMLKPYNDRVESTLTFLEVLASYCDNNVDLLIEKKKEAEAFDLKQNSFAINWELDSTRYVERDFKGFEYDYLQSEIAGTRLKYYDDKPISFKLPYYNSYSATSKIEVPSNYIVPAAWKEVVQRLEANGVEMTILKSDTIVEVSSYYIKEYQYTSQPYEGHFLMRGIRVAKKQQKRTFRSGDYFISTDQASKRFIVSVLEPEAVDSYMRWNFFDEVIQQKEGFSSYVFEETAIQLLKESAELRANFEAWKLENPELANNNRAALDFIYKHSDYYEKEHLRYPVARVE